LPEARDPNHRWQGVTAIYQTPAYNTKLVAEAELPQSHEDFAKLSKFAGRVAINDNDSEWLMSLLSFYGEPRPDPVDGDDAQAGDGERPSRSRAPLPPVNTRWR
jgi:ABC-type Fe3+ transport system substrate-binding protein